MTLPLGFAAHSVPAFLIELGALLLMMAVLARLAHRTGFSPIPLYLIAGLVIGAIAPVQLNTNMVAIETQLAVILLLFMLGLEYNAPELTDSLRAGLPAGLLDIALNFTPGALMGIALGWEPLQCVLLGGITYISSSSIIAKVLDDLNRLGNNETPAILSVLVLEDLAMAPYLPFIAVLVAGGTVAMAGLSLLIAVTAVTVMIVIAKRHSHHVTRGISHSNDEVVLLTVIGFLLIAGGFGETLQISAGVIAFLIGITITGSLADQTRQLLEPLRDLFAAIFFVLFGIQVDVAQIPHVLGIAAALWLITSITKFATGWYAARRLCATAGRFRAGMALVARGEFNIVIAGLAIAAGDSSMLAPLAATYVLLCAVTGPIFTRSADAMARHSIAIARRIKGPPQKTAP